jgi:calcium-dependent protein kinase
MNEIKILLKLDHPAIVKIYGLFESDGHVFVVLEYVKGGSLQEIIKSDHKFTETELLLLSRNVFQTLNYLHSKNVIHRDVKFENILIVDREKMKIKLIDFDLACFYDPSSEFAKKSCGTPGYIAPEVFTNNYDFKVDVYSAGLLLYSL